MFQRFTKQARAVVVRAHEEAAALGSDRIGAEHLLVALAPEERVLDTLGLGADPVRAELRAGARPDKLDAAALASIGIDLDEVRRRVEQAFGPGALSARRRGRLHFTPGAKKALELALREALALNDNHIGSAHILLGVMRDPDDALADLLRRRGRTPKAVRAAVLAARQAAA